MKVVLEKDFIVNLDLSGFSETLKRAMLAKVRDNSKWIKDVMSGGRTVKLIASYNGLGKFDVRLSALDRYECKIERVAPKEEELKNLSNIKGIELTMQVIVRHFENAKESLDNFMNGMAWFLINCLDCKERNSLICTKLEKGCLEKSLDVSSRYCEVK